MASPTSQTIHIYTSNVLKTHSFIHHVATRNSSTGKVVSTLAKKLGLPGTIDDVIAKWKNMALPVTRTPIWGYHKVSNVEYDG